MSHSSQSHGSPVHQSPDVIHGPAQAWTRHSPFDEIILTGFPPAAHQTCAGHGGRNRRSAIFKLEALLISFEIFSAVIRKLSGRWVSSSSGAPTLFTPTRLRMRASVISSFSG